MCVLDTAATPARPQVVAGTSFLDLGLVAVPMGTSPAAAVVAIACAAVVAATATALLPLLLYLLLLHLSVLP